MANYIGMARTNAFRVKDLQAFMAWAETVPELEIHATEDEEGPAAEVVVFVQHCDCGVWPRQRVSEDDEWDYIEFDIFEEIAAHLEPGSVCVGVEIGFEKMRALSGSAVAVDASGKQVTIETWRIFNMAREAFGPDATITEF